MYLVTRMPKLRRWAINTDVARLNAQVPTVVNIITADGDITTPMDGNEDTFNIFVIMSDDLEMIKNYVKTLAEKNPGVTYYISKPVTGLVCPAAPVKELSFSEKGILPV